MLSPQARNSSPIFNWEMWLNRPPSQTWEALPLATVPPTYFWIWFKPPVAPNGLVLRVPEELPVAVRATLTLRMLLHSAGVDPAWIWGGSSFGFNWEGAGGNSPLFDQAVPRSAPGVDPSIVVQLLPMSAVPMSALPLMPAQSAISSGAASVESNELYEAIERDWSGCLQAEKELAMARKQLDGVAARLNSLNRDLTPEEFRNSDRQDRDDWADARRMLRDGASRVTRFIKEQDVGDTTYTGKRRWFEQILEQYIVPRQPCEGLAQIARDFEGHRKLLQQLVLNMTSAASNASQMGERKAQSVLSRIAAKGRAANSKR